MQKRIELSVLPLLCVPSLSHFPKLLLFCPPNAGCPGHTSGIPSFDPFWPVRNPILLGLAPCTPVPFYSSICPPSCPTLSHALNPLTFFFLLSPTFCPSFRVISWNQTLFLGGVCNTLIEIRKIWFTRYISFKGVSFATKGKSGTFKLYMTKSNTSR